MPNPTSALVAKLYKLCEGRVEAARCRAALDANHGSIRGILAQSRAQGREEVDAIVARVELYAEQARQAADRPRAKKKKRRKVKVRRIPTWPKAEVKVELLARPVVQAEYSSRKVVQRVGEARENGWESLSLRGMVLTDGDIAAMVREKGVEQLRGLDLAGPDEGDVTKITDAALMLLAERCTRLHELDISECRHITDEGFGLLARGCRELWTLRARGHFEHMTDEALASIAANCRRLEVLDLGHCKPITEAGIAKIAERCRNLRVVELPDPCCTDAALQALGKHCPGLQELRLGQSRMLSDKGLQAIAEGCRVLRHLSLCHATLATDAGFSAVVSSCRLFHLSAEHCDGLGDDTLRALAQQGRCLRSLNLHKCHRITDEGLEAVAARCRGMEEIVLSGCTGITSLEPLVALLPRKGGKLRRVCILGKGVGREYGLRKLAKVAGPELEIMGEV